MGWTAPRTWVTAEVVTAALMNTHVRDNLRYLKGLDGTPTIASGLILDNTDGDEFLQVPSLTTTERNAITGTNGRMVYNETVNRMQAREGGAWANFTAAITPITKTADETVNNSTSMQDDNELAFAVGANEEWAGLLLLRALSTAVADFKFQFTVPTGAAMAGVGFDALTATFVAEVDFTASVFRAGTGGADAMLAAYFFTYLGGGSGGTAQLQWAQNTGEVSNTTVYAGSTILAWRT